MSKRDLRIEGIKVNDIVCFVSKGNEIIAYLNKPNKKQQMRHSLIQLAGRLPRGEFTRIHRSYLIKTVLLQKIQRKEVGSGWEVKCKGISHPIPVGRTRVSVVRSIVADNAARETQGNGQAK